jgi:hypothetical protein
MVKHDDKFKHWPKCQCDKTYCKNKNHIDGTPCPEHYFGTIKLCSKCHPIAIKSPTTGKSSKCSGKKRIPR